jgi:hypothetical protein
MSQILLNIQINKKSWAGHVVRLENGRTVKTVFKLEGAYSGVRGDSVTQDIRALGVKTGGT